MEAQSLDAIADGAPLEDLTAGRVLCSAEPADKVSAERAMAAASIRPDTEFREEDRSTAAWHYIDICLQDKETDIPARCLHGSCVMVKNR
jgi:hypothetical protein